MWNNDQAWIAGFLRGLILAVLGAVVAFVTSLTVDDMPGYLYALIPAALYSLRQLEAIALDQFHE